MKVKKSKGNETMEILLLSCLCSNKEYERMFKKYGTTLSHAGQKFHSMMLNGFVVNECKVYALSQRIIETGGEDDLYRPAETENGITYTYLPRYSNKVFNRLLTIVAGHCEICKWHREHPDGIIICDVLAGELSIALLIAKIFNKKIKTTALVTDVPGIRAGDNRKGLRALPVKLKNSLIFAYDSYIFLTEQMNKVLNPKGKPYSIVEGIVDGSVIEEPNLLENKYPEKVCIMAGLLEDIYGVNTLLEAFRSISCPEARLFFYGKGNSVADIIEASEADKRIEYKGELLNSELVLEEKRATLLINPRPPIGEWTAYSFPSKNMEYMASGTPMLAYVLPCMPEEYFPYFYHVGECEFSSKLHEVLCKERKELHEFGMASQKWIIEHKNMACQTAKVLAMLNELLIG